MAVEILHLWIRFYQWDWSGLRCKRCDHIDFKNYALEDYGSANVLAHYEGPAKDGCEKGYVFVKCDGDARRKLKGVVACMRQDCEFLAKRELKFLEVVTGTRINPRVAGWDFERGERVSWWGDE